MTYSIIGILAIIIHLIINRDVLWNIGNVVLVPARKEYRGFIISILVFCVTDVFWGFLNDAGIVPLLYAVTVLYFIAMMVAFMMWTRFVIAYLGDDGVLHRVLLRISMAMVAAEVVILIINFFVPIQFHFDENGTYIAGGARYVTLGLQVVLFLLTSLYTATNSGRSPNSTRHLRRTVVLFGISMSALIVLQWFYPMLPLYSIGYMLSSCLLHSFVVEEEKEEYRKKLEDTLRREQAQKQELGSAKRRINTDPLTGMKSKQAYMDDAIALNRRVQDGEAESFAVAVFDLNNLKQINDTQGHDAGDISIYTASMLITEFFPGSPVYRIGGDEFAAILTGEDYRDRDALLQAFDAQIEENLRAGKVTVASGMAEFRPGADMSFRSVFDRADKQMYRRKKALKEVLAGQ